MASAVDEATVNAAFDTVSKAITATGKGQKALEVETGALGAPGDGVLAALDTQLSNAKKGTALDLAGALSAGQIKTFFGAIGTGGAFTIDPATITYPDNDNALTVSGSFDGLGLGPLTVSVQFTVAEDGKTLVAAPLITGTLEWGWSEALWLTLAGPHISATISDSASVAGSGELGATFGVPKPWALVAFEVPQVAPYTWIYVGKPSLSNFSQLFQLVGGVNLAATLPSQISPLASLSLEQVVIAYDTSTKQVTSMGATIGTTKPWPLPIPGITVSNITVDVSVDQPTVTPVYVGWTLSGTFALNNTGSIVVTATYPDWTITAALAKDSTIHLSDFGKNFGLPAVPIPGDPTLTFFALSLTFTGSKPWSIGAGLSADWSIPLPSNSKLTITGLSFQLTGDGQGLSTARLAGTTKIGTGDDAPNFEVSASYAKSAWTFETKQTTGTIKLVDLLTAVAPKDWKTDSDKSAQFNITNLDLSVTPSTGAYSVSGEVAAKWDILGGFDLVTKARIASDGKTPSGALEATINEAFGVKKLGLKISYEFTTDRTQVYGLSWKGLSGKYTIPPAGQDPILEIDVVGWTLGGLIEELVSFATGAKFSLGSPWDLLDEVPLDCTLKFDMKTNQIWFTYPLSIDIGIASLSSITITYNPQGTQKVGVELAGRFPWQQEQTLKWDAADPATTPAPPGSGNKYLDLRVLALGQHVALTDLPDKATTKQIVDQTGALATPDGKNVPVPSTGIAYSSANSWLIAADFGVLKNEGTNDYFLDMSLLFDDPDLYGLHIELAGPTAKIFAGLKFDILYRKVTDTIGVYQAELTLPSALRQFDVGAFSITLPQFAIAVYTNGDFQVDLGFPWNNDFSRSFTIQGFIGPVPVIGSGGFYFGKLSSATATEGQVPVTTKGTFNPIIVFGIGLQVGVGKTFQAGPFSAGITVTVLGIVEGVVASWHPNTSTEVGPAGSDQLQGHYYFKLTGTAGLAVHLFGNIDFAIIKASVDVRLSVTVSLTYESFRAIPITVSASVSVELTVTIDLGLFKIHIHCGFSTSITETFTIGSNTPAPWDDGSSLTTGVVARERRMAAAHTERLLTAGEKTLITLDWTKLPAPQTSSLTLYCTPVLTVVGDGATTPGQQTAAYVVLTWIESVNPSAGSAGGGADTSFEALAKEVLRWAVAAGGGPTDDTTPVKDECLADIIDALANPDNPLPLPPSCVDTFLEKSFTVTNMSAPATTGSANVTFFPMPPHVTLAAPNTNVDFSSFNSVDGDYLKYLATYFGELDVQVQEESGGSDDELASTNGDGKLSMASYVYADYFTVIARHMLGAARAALRNLKLPVPSDPKETVDDTVGKINAAGELTGADALTRAHLFEANAGHPLSGGKAIGIAYVTAAGDTLASVVARYAGQYSFTPTALATGNHAVAGAVSPGLKITYKPTGAEYLVLAGDDLDKIVSGTKATSIADLVANSDITTASLATGVALLLPAGYTTTGGETLASVAAAFDVPAAALGEDVAGNGGLTTLFEPGATEELQFLNVPHLPQYPLPALIQEAQQSLAIQTLSGMVARFFLHGIRLPKDETGTSEAGLFALTGQQVPVATQPNVAPFDMDMESSVSWLVLS